MNVSEPILAHPPTAASVDSEVQDYRNYVLSVAEAENEAESPDADSIILNRGVDFASVVVEVIFKRARDSVRILTRFLNPDVYGKLELIDASIKFLQANPKATIEILTESEIKDDHPFLLALRAAGLLERMKLWLIPTEVCATYEFNFAVADGRHFRFEQNRATREAIIQFNDSAFGARLERAFASLRSKAILRSHN